MHGPLIVLAGAGTGKTRVLTTKLSKIIKENYASPYEILTVTFTNKAANEMKNRVESILKIFPSENAKEERQVLRLFSPDFEYEVKRVLSKKPNKINEIVPIRLTASDDVDQLNKGNFPRDLPEDRRRVSNFQLNIYDNLVEQGKIGKKFNDYFFLFLFLALLFFEPIFLLPRCFLG